MSTEKQITFAANGRGLQVDIEKLIWSRALLQANSGGGKSHALRQLLEETFGRVPQHVIDPEGEFVSLRERFDYVYAATSGGDVAVSVRTAAVLARRLVELGASVVIDLSGLTKPDRREFVKRYVTELMSLPRALWKPLLVVLDEAHDFCPEKGHGEAVSTDAVIDLCCQGRKRGFCAVLATQRISKLNKDAAAELNNKLIGRTGLDVDVKRAGDELGLDKDGRAALKTLEPGEFFAFGPAISPSVERVRTGKVLTSHPKAGQVSSAPPPAPAKVRAMLAQLADLPQEAEKHEHALEALEREVRSLRAELARAKAAAPAPAERVKVPVITEADRQLVTQFFGEAKTELDRVAGKFEVLGEIIAGFTVRAPPPPISRVMGVTRADAAPVRSLPKPSSQPAASASTLPKGERAVLTAIAQHEGGVTREQLTVLTGYKRSTRDKFLQHLRADGLIADGAVITATADGVRALGSDFEPLPTGSALLEHWLSKLPQGERVCLEAIVAHFPAPISRDAICEATKYQRSTRDKFLQHLASRKLISEPARGQVRASEALFDHAPSARAGGIQ
jgi:hypothetical protein